MSEVEKIQKKSWLAGRKENTRVVHLEDVLPLAERLDNIKKLLENRPRTYHLGDDFANIKEISEWIKALERELK